MNNQLNDRQPILTQQANLPMTPINTTEIVEHGESTTAIILAITILMATMFGSVTVLVQVVLQGQSQHSR